MKLFVSIIIVALYATSGIAATRADSLIKQLNDPADGKVMVASHRGDWRFTPENSIAAIEHCIEAGADIVELDLQMTKDSVLILMHDSTLNRTTNGKGNVADWSMDSIRTLYLKNGCAIKTRHKVPTLEEAMLAAKGKILVNLDKADKYFMHLLPILRKTGTAAQVIMKSNRTSADVLSAFGDGYNEVIYMPKINYEEAEAMDALNDVTANLATPVYEFKYATPANFDKAMKGSQRVAGKSRIWYNTLWDSQCGGHDDEVALTDPDASYGFLIDTLKASIIQTDRLELLLNYLRSKNLHD